MKGTLVQVDDKELRLSNLDKVLYPEAKFTKAEVIAYYSQIAEVILPHLRGRPLTLKRYPDGVTKEFFYEKQCPSHRPQWMPTAPIHSRSSKRGTVNYCLIEDRAGLMWVANLASLELHTLLSRADDPDRPTMMVFDLDPGEGMGMLQCAQIALRMRDALRRLKLQSFAKTSGGKGLHFYVPLNTPVTFEQTKSFARMLAELFERQDSELVTSNMRKDLRRGRVFVDWSQNDSHKTTVCAYSLRARARPTVSTPVTWEELGTAVRRKDESRLIFETDAVLRRVRRKGDLFEAVLKLKQRLPALSAAHSV